MTYHDLDIMWVMDTEEPHLKDFLDRVCVRCWKMSYEHADGKCLFGPWEYLSGFDCRLYDHYGKVKDKNDVIVL
jgi:hypothetical protein